MSTPTGPIATLHQGGYKAEVYSSDLPGEFTIRFLDGQDQVLESINMTGVSTYRQRESEILDRLRSFAAGKSPGDAAELSASGEY
jgi:hypothetical protein